MAAVANERAGSDRPPRQWLQNPLRTMFAKHQSPGTIREVEMVTASMKRLVIEADAVSRWDDTPGQHVRVQINDPLSLRGVVRPSETLRTYTVWDTWPQKKRFEIRAHLFDGEGIGRRWIDDATAGEQFVFWGPMGARDLPPASCYLFAGDETAAAGVGQLARSLMGTGEILGVFESDSPDHDMEMAGFDRLVRVHRHGDSPVESEKLCHALRQLDLPQDGVAYIGGEAKTGQALRRLLIEEKGWDRSSIIARPFWATGKPGLHH